MFSTTGDGRPKTGKAISPSSVPGSPSVLRPYFPAPFGDMMIAGCFGLLAAVADVLPEFGHTIRESLKGFGRGTPPWEIE